MISTPCPLLPYGSPVGHCVLNDLSPPQTLSIWYLRGARYKTFPDIQILSLSLSFPVNFIIIWSNTNNFSVKPVLQSYSPISLLVDGDLDCRGVMVRNVSQYANDCARLSL